VKLKLTVPVGLGFWLALVLLLAYPLNLKFNSASPDQKTDALYATLLWVPGLYALARGLRKYPDSRTFRRRVMVLLSALTIFLVWEFVEDVTGHTALFLLLGVILFNACAFIILNKGDDSSSN